MSSGIMKNDSMMYLGETPWHGLGTKVTEAKTSEEAIKIAGLDWDIYKVPKMTQEYETPDGIIIPSMPVEEDYCIVRSDTQEIIGKNVGSRYSIMNNKSCFEFFDSIVGSKEAIYHTCGSLFNGSKIWILAKLPDFIRIKNTDDITEEYILLASSHDGKMGIIAQCTGIRVVCNNTLTQALNSKTSNRFAVRHTPNYRESIETARRTLGISKEYFINLGEILNEFANYDISEKQLDKFTEELFPISKKQLEKAEEDEEEAVAATRTLNTRSKVKELFEVGTGNDLPGIKGTAVALYNAVTEYADYYRPVRASDSESDSRLDSVWFGTASKLKNDAFALTKSIIGIN